MADSLAVLSGSSCSCTVFCGIQPWYRWKFQWSRGDLVPHGQIGTTSERVGSIFNTSISTKYLTESWEDGDFAGGGCCPGITGTSVTGTTYDVQSFAKGSYGNSSTYMRYTYAGNGVNGGYALIDVNVGKYITDKPTATTLSVRTFIGTWYYIINNFTSPEFFNASGQSFFDYANFSWNTTQYCCWAVASQWGWICDWCDYHSYRVVRGGLSAQTYYGKTSFSTQSLLGSSTAATISVVAVMYDKDPNTAGASIIAGDSAAQTVATATSPSIWETPYTTTIDLKTLGFSVV